MAVVILVSVPDASDPDDDSDLIFSARAGSSIAARGLVMYAAEKYQESARAAMRRDLQDE